VIGWKYPIAINSSAFARDNSLARARAAERGADRLAEAVPGAKAPAAGDADDLVRAPAQLLADIVDEQFETASRADDPREGLAGDRLGGGEDDGLDAPHPFPPSRRGRKILEFEIELALGLSRSRHDQSP
jgi:hypothetical protein